MGYRYLYTKNIDDNAQKVWGAFVKYRQFNITAGLFGNAILHGALSKHNMLMDMNWDPVYIILFYGETNKNNYKLTTTKRYDRLTEYARNYRSQGYNRLVQFRAIADMDATNKTVSECMPVLHEAVLKTVIWLDLQQ